MHRHGNPALGISWVLQFDIFSRFDYLVLKRQVALAHKHSSAGADANRFAGSGLFGRMFHLGRLGLCREQSSLNRQPKRKSTSQSKSHFGKGIRTGPLLQGANALRARPKCRTWSEDSLTPNFSWVGDGLRRRNRFNGFGLVGLTRAL